MGRIGRMTMSNPLPERIKALLESDPYAGVLGLSVSIIDGAIQTKSETSHSLVGNVNLPALHGGVVGSLMMLTASLELHHQLDSNQSAMLLDMDVDYLRSGRVIPTYGRADLLRLGRRTATMTATLWQEDKNRPIAFSRMSFLVKPQGDESPALG